MKKKLSIKKIIILLIVLICIAGAGLFAYFELRNIDFSNKKYYNVSVSEKTASDRAEKFAIENNKFTYNNYDFIVDEKTIFIKNTWVTADGYDYTFIMTGTLSNNLLPLSQTHTVTSEVRVLNGIANYVSSHSWVDSMQITKDVAINTAYEYISSKYNTVNLGGALYYITNFKITSGNINSYGDHLLTVSGTPLSMNDDKPPSDKTQDTLTCNLMIDHITGAVIVLKPWLSKPFALTQDFVDAMTKKYISENSKISINNSEYVIQTGDSIKIDSHQFNDDNTECVIDITVNFNKTGDPSFIASADIEITFNKQGITKIKNRIFEKAKDENISQDDATNYILSIAKFNNTYTYMNNDYIVNDITSTNVDKDSDNNYDITFQGNTWPSLDNNPSTVQAKYDINYVGNILADSGTVKLDQGWTNATANTSWTFDSFEAISIVLSYIYQNNDTYTADNKTVYNIVQLGVSDITISSSKDSADLTIYGLLNNNKDANDSNNNKRVQCKCSFNINGTTSISSPWSIPSFSF